MAQKCFREVQSRSPRMAVDLRTRGPGAGNLPAANLQWKNGVGSDPALRPRPRSADCFEEVRPRTGSDEYGTAHAEHFCGTPPSVKVWKCGSDTP